MTGRPGRFAPAGALGAALLAALIAAAPADAAPTLPRHACPSAAVASAGQAWGTSEAAWSLTGGPPANVMLSVEPTRRGRALWLAGGAPDRLWGDVIACAPLPDGLTAAQRRSLRLQLVCHAVWSGGPLRRGGDTWELEAWRPPVPRAEVLSPDQVTDEGKRCNWGPDTGPAYARPTPAAATAAAVRGVARRVLGLRLPGTGAP